MLLPIILQANGKVHFDNGNKQISAMSVLRRCLQLSPLQGTGHPLKRSNSRLV